MLKGKLGIWGCWQAAVDMYRIKGTVRLVLMNYRLCLLGDKGSLQRGKEAWGGAILLLEEFLKQKYSVGLELC